MALTFESEDKILLSGHSNKISQPVLSHGAICFCYLFVTFCLWPHLAVKGILLVSSIFSMERWQ